MDDLLASMVEASSDFEGAVVVGHDGLLMAAAWPDQGQSDLDVGAVAARAFTLSAQAGEMLARGDLERLILLGSDGNLVIARAGSHALCVAMLTPQAKVGVASFEAVRIGQAVAALLG
jgi:predicted regulator of Ras-like GTPase activity (Roadblock/LC7/MglB family)